MEEQFIPKTDGIYKLYREDLFQGWAETRIPGQDERQGSLGRGQGFFGLRPQSSIEN
jgi:hypothetical protein